MIIYKFSTVQKQVDSLLWLSILDLICDSLFTKELRIESTRIESRIESSETENKRFTHDWFLNNFAWNYMYM